MRLRGKLFVAQAPLVGALVLIAGAALYAAIRFGSAPGVILYENFRSFDASRGMIHAVDAIDARVLSATLEGVSLDRSSLATHVHRFESELRLQESNVTEAGEAQATRSLRRAWEAYRGGLGTAAQLDGIERHRATSSALRSAIDTILEMNRDAMQSKADRARDEGHRIGGMLAGTAVVAFLVAVLASGAWLRRVLTPLHALERAVDRVSAGDFDARISIDGGDEIASLSASFNDMAARLAQYRASSVGELLEANNRLASVMDSLADAVVVYDLEGTPIAHNAVAARVLGAGGLRLDAMPEELQDAARNALETVRGTGEAWEPASLEAAVELTASPSPRWLLVSATPVRRSGEVLAGITVALRDVTRTRRLEGFKGDLVATTAHELRTPLTSLHMAVQLCLEEVPGPLTDHQRKMLAAAREDSERLQAVVEELLELARLESGSAPLSRTPMDVADLVRDAVARHRAEARGTGDLVAVFPDDAPPTVVADASRLRRVLDNLIENALRHGGSGGRIEIGVERRNGAIRVFVDDAGPGIPEEMRERVFAKFFRVPGTSRHGTGLGLSIVRDIVRSHGGEVGVDQAPMGGARVWFTIPQVRETDADHDEASGPSPPTS